MDEQEKARRAEQVVERARKQLADGSWPQVVAVATYPNPKAPRVSDEEFDRLKLMLEELGYKSMSTFLGLVQLHEKERNVTMSYNLVRRPRPTEEAEGSPRTVKEVLNLFSCPDILVGTRTGTEGAASWLGKVSQVMPTMAPEVLQVMDKTFGEAVTVLTNGTSHRVNLSEMLRSVLGAEEGPVPSPPPTKH